MSHGHIRPNPDGVQEHCGGPGMCDACRKELVFAFRDIKVILDKLRFCRDRVSEFTEADRTALLEGLVVDVNKIDRICGSLHVKEAASREGP